MQKTTWNPAGMTEIFVTSSRTVSVVGWVAEGYPTQILCVSLRSCQVAFGNLTYRLRL